MRLNLIKGVGKRKLELFNQLGIYTVKDLYTYLPIRYEDRSKKVNVANSIHGVKNYYVLQVISIPKTVFYNNNKTVTRLKAKDDTGQINIIWYNDRFSSKLLLPNNKYKFYGYYDVDKNAIINPITSKLEDDYIGGIIPIYRYKKGMSIKNIIKFKDDLISSNYRIKEYFSEVELKENNLMEINEMYKNLHRPSNNIDLYKAMFTFNLRKIFLDKLSTKIYLNNLNKDSIKFKNYNIDEYILNLPFNLTDSQNDTIEEIISDMCSDKRMNRIIIGDVGSGKTVVSILAAILAVKNGYQVAFMAPTEILSIQHFENYKSLLDNYNIRTNLLIGSTKSIEKKNIYKNLENFNIDIIFGTHSLFQENVKFNKLGLVITDEQQRFGVYQRKLLNEKGYYPDVLLLSATPIPRTLALTMYNNLDISFMKSLPKNRKSITSYYTTIYQEKKFINFAYSRILEGEQVYIVTSRVEEDENLESVYSLYDKLNNYFNGKVKLDILHGKLSSEEKKNKQNLFKSKKIDILIATSIIEVGIDNPNATVMIIYDSNQFGLSQLHQIRGRVGRSNLKSYCFFVTNEKIKDNEKIDFIVNNSDGFEIAKKDLELRGSGELFGSSQSGFIDVDNSFMFNEDINKLANKLVENSDIKNENLSEELENKLLELNKIILN